MTSDTLLEVLKPLQKLHTTGIDLSLKRIEALLHKLGNPQERLPPVIHVAGTNGKGSTLSFIQRILQESGLIIHRYTSPHLARFNERIILANREIEDDRFIRMVRHVTRINAGKSITFFEMITAVALILFSRIQADFVLLETGLGGRLDASNVVPRPAISVITSISHDHQAFLGNTIEKITREKAGIMRKNCPVVIAKQGHKAAENILVDCAASIGAPIFCHGFQWRYSVTKSGFTVDFMGNNIALPPPRLNGEHQYENASSAVVVCKLLRQYTSRIGEAHLVNGIKNAIHRGRFEHLTTGVAKRLPRCTVYIDGAHNPSAAIMLNATLRSMSIKNIVCVVGMTRNKDVTAFIAPLQSSIAKVYVVPLQDHEIFELPGQSVAALAKSIKGRGIKDVIPCASLEQAIERIRINDNGTVLFTGSLHLVGQILSTVA